MDITVLDAATLGSDITFDDQFLCWLSSQSGCSQHFLFKFVYGVAYFDCDDIWSRVRISYSNSDIVCVGSRYKGNIGAISQTCSLCSRHSGSSNNSVRGPVLAAGMFGAALFAIRIQRTYF